MVVVAFGACFHLMDNEDISDSLCAIEQWNAANFPWTQVISIFAMQESQVLVPHMKVPDDDPACFSNPRASSQHGQ